MINCWKRCNFPFKQFLPSAQMCLDRRHYHWLSAPLCQGCCDVAVEFKPRLLVVILTVTLCADASTALQAEHSDASLLCTFWSVDEMNVCDCTVEVEAAPYSRQSRYAFQFLRRSALWNFSNHALPCLFIKKTVSYRAVFRNLFCIVN